MNKQRIIDLQKSVRLARTALERITHGSRDPESIAAAALEEMWKLEPRQQLQHLVGHASKPRS